METILIIAIAVAFVVLLLSNFYFRYQVIRAYRQLVRAGVEFEARDMLRKERVDAVVARYPAQEKELRTFTDGIRKSMQVAVLLIALITLLGGVLMWYR